MRANATIVVLPRGASKGKDGRNHSAVGYEPWSDVAYELYAEDHL